MNGFNLISGTTHATYIITGFSHLSFLSFCRKDYLWENVELEVQSPCSHLILGVNDTIEINILNKFLSHIAHAWMQDVSMSLPATLFEWSQISAVLLPQSPVCLKERGVASLGRPLAWSVLSSALACCRCSNKPLRFEICTWHLLNKIECT